MPTDLETRCRLAFEDWWTTIASSEALKRRPEAPMLVLRTDPHNSLTAQILPRHPPAIEVFRGFLDDIREEIGANADRLRTVCLYGFDERDGPLPTLQDIERCVGDLSISFVLLHELFHLLCGHIDERRGAAPDLPLACDAAPAASGVRTEPSLDRLRAYYLELEADNSALQWLMRSAVRESVDTFVAPLEARGPRSGPSMAELEGPARLMAFRALVAAVWLMVRLWERRRGESLREQSPEHPLPAARLLAALATIMEQFVELTELTLDPVGRKVQRLSEEEAEDSRTFLLEVVKPLLREPWPVRDHRAVADGLEAFPPSIALELGNLLRLRGAESSPGRELERLETLRVEIGERLELRRYF